MPRKVSSATFLPVLAALAYEYALEASLRGLIADRALPVFETNLQTAEYPVIPSEVFLKIYETKRAPRSGYKNGDYEFKFQSFATQEFGWEELIDDREAALYGSLFSAQEVAMMRAVDILMRSREKRVADMLFNIGNFSNTPAGVAWSSLEGCDPRGDVRAVKKLVRDVTGMLPNAVIMSWTNFQNLISCKSFLDHVKYTDPVLVRDEEYQRGLVAKYLGVDEVLIGNAVRDSAKKGQDTSVADIWSSSYALVCRIAKNARDLRESCIGRTFLWTGDSPQMLTTETYRNEEKRSDVIRVRHDLDEEFVFQACGYLLTGLA